MRIFSKDKKINIDTKPQILFDLFKKEIEKMIVSNIRNELKALKSIDVYNKPLEGNTEVTKSSMKNEVTIDIQQNNSDISPADLLTF